MKPTIYEDLACFDFDEKIIQSIIEEIKTFAKKHKINQCEKYGKHGKRCNNFKWTVMEKTLLDNLVQQVELHFAFNIEDE